MREIVLDTETTGLDPKTGDRIVEIGCVELFNHLPTGEIFHRYINPERDMPAEAFAVHGLSEEFLAKHPVFAEVAEDFLKFVGDSPLIIHNAQFDMKFINAELAKAGRAEISMDQTRDTLAVARRRFPGSPASLDALCKRFGIDNASRTKHGALLDSELLAEVYLELVGGREPGLELAKSPAAADSQASLAVKDRKIRPPRPHEASTAELAAHEDFLKKIKEPLWSAA